MRAEGRDCAITAMTDRITGWRLLGCISDQENQKNLININIGTLMAGVIGLIFGCVIAVLTALSFNHEIKNSRMRHIVWRAVIFPRRSKLPEAMSLVCLRRTLTV